MKHSTLSPTSSAVNQPLALVRETTENPPGDYKRSPAYGEFVKVSFRVVSPF